MIERTKLFLITFASLSAGSASAYGDAVKLVPIDRNLRVQDLANVAEAVGIKFKIFDYEVVEPHRVHFFVEEIDSTDARTKHDGSGICGLGGPHRLTVQWKAESGALEFTFMLFRSDIEQGGSVLGPKLEIPEPDGFSLYGIEAPHLQHDHEALLIHGSYGRNDGLQSHFKVLAELRPNQDRVVGTE